MAFYRKKPVVIEASQWFKDGDHPMVRNAFHQGRQSPVGSIMVGDEPGGWIDTLEGGHVVAPGDWIITGIKGEHYPCKPDIFAETYDLVDADISNNTLTAYTGADVHGVVIGDGDEKIDA